MRTSAIRALEPRFVFDGAAAPAAAQAHSDAAAQSHGDQTEKTADGGHVEAADKQTASPAAVAPGHETATGTGRHEIVVIDKGVADLKTLLAGIPNSAEVILIDSGKDGFDQLADALKGRSDIDAIHILSHGSAGDLHLGTGELTAETIQGRYAADLAIIGKALTATGDLLIYGCDFAAGTAGARAAALLAQATGADVAASDDATGDARLGGDWDLEVHDGPIETGVVVSEAAQRDWHHLLAAAADNGRGALLAVSGRTIYSVDIQTGKAIALTTAPDSVGGITLSGSLNSLAVDQANGLIYYVDNASPDAANKNALFAYDFRNDQHILIDGDLSDNGVTTGTPGLAGAGAAFSNGSLYLAVENVDTNGRDQIYRLTFTNSGRTVASGNTFGNQSNHNYDWGDISIDQASGQLISLTRTAYARFNLSDGSEASYDTSVTRTDVQSGVDQGGYIYTLGTNITRIDPTTGAAIGSGVRITTDGSTALNGIIDAASWTPPTSTIGGRVFADVDENGASDTGEPGVRGVTVQLVDDVNGNGLADAGERVLATDTSAADGSYSFTGLLPGQFVVRVTDAQERLTTARATTPTAGSVTDRRVGATLAGPDFGYNPALVLDLDDSAAGTGYATNYTERAPGVAIVDSDVSIADATSTDIASAKAVITNGSRGDTLSVDGTLPAGITAAYDAATFTLTLTGSKSATDYQTALQQIRFSNNDRDPSAVARNIAVTVNDGTINSNTTNSTVAFQAVDDAPVNTVPGAQTVAEDTGLVFSQGNGNAIRVFDPDAGTGELTTMLSAQHGTITLGSTNGVTVSGNGTGSVTLTGTVAAINAALDGTRYQGVQDYNGSDTLSVDTTDNGNTGSGGPLTDTDTVAITVTPVNDAPVLDLDASETGTGYATNYTEGGGPVAIVDADVSVTDVDSANIASAKAVITNFRAGDSLSFVGTPPTGITASYDAATHTLTLTGSASKADYQTALQQIRFSSTGQDPSTETRNIAVTVNDGALDSNVATTAIVFDAVNDPPVNTVPGAQTVAEDTGLVFSQGNGNAIRVSDPDAGTGELTTMLSAQHGTITLGSTNGVTVSGNGTGSVTLTGTVAAINAALDGTRYQGVQDYNGADTLSVDTTDNGNTGSGGPLTDTDTVAITVTPVNDAPVNGVPPAQSVSEDTDLVFSAGNNNAITVSDVDAGNGSLTVTLGVGHGTLTIGGTANVTVTGSGTGSVTLRGTVADINAALNGTTYRGTANYNGADSLTIATSDEGNTGAGGTLSDTDTVALTVNPVADPPANSVPPATQTTNEDTPLVFSAGNGNAVSVSDPDGGTLTVTLSSGQGVLTLSRTAGLTFLQGDGIGDATMRFSGSIADINAALAGLRFDPEADRNGAAQIALTTEDPQGATASSTIAVNIAPVADIVPDSVTIDEDMAITFNAVTGTNGASADTFENPNRAVTSVTQGAHGSVSFRADGTMTYTPDANYNGTDSFTYTVTSGGTTETATVTVTVRSVNDVPQAGTLPSIGALDSQVITGQDLGRYFTDADGDALRFSADRLPPGLTIDPATGIVSGTIAHSASRGGSNGDYAVTVTADDGHGGVTSRSFTWRVVNPAPNARDDGALTNASTPLTGSVLPDNGNGPDSDPDGDQLAVSAVNGAAGGVGQAVAGSAGGRFTVLADGSYRFDPGADFADLAAGQTRTTRITYTISDGDGGFAQATLAVTVTGRNQAPAALAPGDRAAGDGDTVRLPVDDLFPNANGASYSATGLPPGLSIDPATGTVSGTIDHAASGASGIADYRVTITQTDPSGSATSRGFTFRVTNPVPQAANDVATTAEDTPITVDVLANDTDRDGDRLAIIASGDAAPSAGHGTVSVVGGRLVYTPAANFNGTDTITYSIVDENGGVSTASVTVTVTSVNDAPTAGTLPDQSGRDGAAVNYDVSTRFRDPDTDPSVSQTPSGDALRFTAAGLPPGLSIDPVTGVISGTLPSDASANTRYSVTITATDSAGASVERGFTWTVSNGAPTAAPDAATTPAGKPVLVAVTANDFDADGDAIRLVGDAGSASAGHGTVSVDPATGLLTYTPDAGFSGKDTVVYTIEDAQGERATGILTVTVTPVNQRPVAPETLPGRNGADGEAVRVPLGNLISDPEGQALAYAATGLPPGLTIDPVTGAITGTIDHNASGPSGRTTYVVTLTATDPGGLAVSRSFAWTVTNPPPTAANDAITTDEDTPVDIDVTSNDTDPDGDPLSVVPGSATAVHGTVTINPDGSLHYTPNRDYNGTDTIIYTITDGNGGFATASVAITVNAVNDAPVFDPASPALADRSANDSQAISIPAGGAFSDVDSGDRLTFGATGLPPGLTIDPATGLISGTIDPGASTRVPNGAYTVALTATDLAGATATARFTITVGNPAPIAVDDDATLAEDTPLEGSVLGNDSDPDGDALRVDPVPAAGPAHGHLDLRPDGTFTYTPDPDFHGEDSFTYVLFDSDGGRSTATVYLTVTPVNDAPTGAADPVRTNEDTPVDGRVVADDRDGDPLGYAVETPPSSGKVTLRPDGSFTYTPGPDFHGSDSFTVRVSDGQGGSVLVTVPVTVDPVNDAPDAHADHLVITAGTTGTGQIVATDRDGDRLSFQLIAKPTNGTVVLGEDGSYSYRPKPDFSGNDQFTVVVDDGNGGITVVTVDILVTPATLVPPPPGWFPDFEPPFLDYPAAPPPLPDCGLDADGIVLPTVAGIDPLGSVGDVILADGAVLAAVNGVDYLYGTTICIDGPIILDESARIEALAWERLEREAVADGVWFSPRPYLGRSLAFSLSTDEVGTGSGDLMVEAIRRPDVLAINLRNDAPETATVSTVRLHGIDGAPPPDWLEGDGKGGFWGRPPAGTGLVAIELEIVLTDGRTVIRPMVVDVETGEVRALVKTRPAIDPSPGRWRDPDTRPRSEVPLFSAQLASLDRRSLPDLTLIEKALASTIRSRGLSQDADLTVRLP